MRPLAIELAFDTVSSERLARVWSYLRPLYGGPGESELGVRPHITLALFRSGEPSDVPAAVDTLASRLTAFPLSLVTVERFPTSEGVVFLRPEASAELAGAHAVLHELLDPQRDLVDHDYRPGAWSPHCTMAVNVPEAGMGPVVAACRASEVLGGVDVTRVQLVRYRPATEIVARALGS